MVPDRTRVRTTEGREYSPPVSPLTPFSRTLPIKLCGRYMTQYERAKDAWDRVLTEAPNHAKVLQQLGWLYHQSSAPFVNQDMAVQYLTRSLETG
jgi:general transcriptional corepressor CYC8